MQHLLHFPADIYLLLVDDVDACLYVREGMRRCQDRFAFVLLMQVTVCPAVQSEGSTVHEGSQVVVLVKVGDSFFQLVCVKVRLDVGNLEVGLEKQFIFFKNIYFFYS